MEVSRCNNHTRLSSYLVHVVLSCRDVQILNPVGPSIHEWLGENLLRYILSTNGICSGEKSFEEKAKLGAADNSWVHVVIVLISGSVVGATPGDGVCAGKGHDMMYEGEIEDNKNSNERVYERRE